MVILNNEVFYKNQPIHMDMSLFFLKNSNLSSGNSDNKCLKSLSSKFNARLSNEAFRNCNESEKMIFLLTIILIYLSSILGITWISISLKLFSSLKLHTYDNPLNYEK